MELGEIQRTSIIKTHVLRENELSIQIILIIPHSIVHNITQVPWWHYVGPDSERAYISSSSRFPFTVGTQVVQCRVAISNYDYQFFKNHNFFLWKETII